MTKLLLIEDEEHIANGIKFNLEMEGYEVTYARDGLIAKELLFDKKELYDLIILDIMIPVINGFDLCFALRKSKNYTPVLMLTAKNFSKDKIHGLQLGADEYITKPFNLEELMTRIEVLLRRKKWEASNNDSNILRFRNVVVDFDAFSANVDNSPVKLTSLEYKLLKIFSENEGKVLSREELFDKVWEIRDDSNFRTIDNFVLRLRKYFELDPSTPRHFHSVRGVGYKFTIEETLT